MRIREAKIGQKVRVKFLIKKFELDETLKYYKKTIGKIGRIKRIEKNHLITVKFRINEREFYPRELEAVK